MERIAAHQQAHAAELLRGIDLQAAVIVDVGGTEERDGGERRAIAMGRNHRAEIEIEDGVAVGDHEGIAAKKIAQAVERTAGAEQDRLGRVGDVQAESRAVAESALNNTREMMKVDCDVDDTGAAQHRDRIMDQRMAAELEHRLWRHLGQRTKPLTHSGRKDQSLHGINAALSLGNSGRIAASIRRACASACGM